MNFFTPGAQTTPGRRGAEQPLPPPQPAVQQEQQPQQVAPPGVQQPQPQPAAPGVQQPAPQAQQPPPVPLPVIPRPPVKRGEVSFNFDDADVYSVIQTIFGDILRVNYIVDPNVKGRVTFRSVAPVPKDDVLPLMEVILRLNGIGIVEESGLYRIVPIGEIPREPAPVGIGRNPEDVKITGKAVLQIVPILYMPSSEVVRVMTPFLSKTAVIIDIPKSNYIAIIDTDSNVRRLLQLIDVLDSEQLKKIKPEVFVYPVQNGKAKDLATMMQQIFLGSRAPAASRPAAQPARAAAPGQPPQPAAAAGAAAGGPAGEGEALVSDITRIFADEITNAIIILATPDDYELIADTIRKIDIVPRQVIIEGLIVRVDLTDNFSLGFAYSFITDMKLQFKQLNKDINLLGGVGIQPGTALDSSTTNFTFLAADPTGNLRLKIIAAMNDSRAKVLAAPHILVSDNREARIQVGQQIPLATSTTATPVSGGAIASNTLTSTIQYKDIGIILKVKPQVNDSGLISLEISQEVSALGQNVQIAGQDFASVTKTEATSNLVAQDGETIIIGGLIREDTTRSKSGIPFLSSIPILGTLFSTTSDSNIRNELIILLTPRVVKSKMEASKVTKEYLDKYQGRTKDDEINEFIRQRKMEKSGGR